MGLRYLSSALEIAVNAATTQTGRLQAIIDAFGGQPITARCEGTSGAHRRTLTLPLPTITTSSPRKIVLGAHLADLPVSTGDIVRWELRNSSGTPILSIDAQAGSGPASVDHAGPVKVRCTPTLAGVEIVASADLPVNAPPVFPFTLPASGAIGSISSNTLNSVASNADEQFSLPKVLSAWCTAAVSLIYTGSTVTDIVYWIFGGGHGDTANDAVYMWRASTGQFSRIVAPSSAAVALMAIPDTAPTADELHGENIFGRPDSQHTYNHLIGLDSTDVQGPALVQAYGTAIGKGAIKSGQAHRLPLNAPTWERLANVAPVPISDAAAVIKDTLRKRLVRFPSDGGTDYYTLDYETPGATWQTAAQSARIGNWSATFEAVGVYDPVRDLYIAGTYRGPGANFCAIAAGSPSGAWTELTFAGTGPANNVYGSGLMHRAVDDTFLLVDTSTSPPTGVWILTPPASAPLTNAWTWTRRSFTGTSRYSSMLASGTETFTRFQYVAALDSIICSGAAGFPMEAWKL